jgi:hypothetical protein
MSDTSRRVVAYGATLTVLSGLVYAGFVYEADPDLLTQLSGVEVRLRYACQARPMDDEGRKAKSELIESAKTILTEVEAKHPDEPLVAEYRAVVAFLEERPLDAAKLYEEQRGLEDCTPEMRSQSVINQARMLRLARRPAEAGRLLKQHVDSLEGEFSEAARAELAAIEADAAKKDGETVASPESRQ